MFILLISILCPFVATWKVSTQQQNETIYLLINGVSNPQFLNSKQAHCHPSTLFFDDVLSTEREFLIENDVSVGDADPQRDGIIFVTHSSNAHALTVNGSQNLVENPTHLIPPRNSTGFVVSYNCYKEWALVQLNIRLGDTQHDFRYVKLCEPPQVNQYPKVVLQAALALVVLVGSIYGGKSFKFRGLTKVSVDEIESCDTFQRQNQSKITIQSYDEEQPFSQDAYKQTKIMIYAGLVIGLVILIGYEDLEIQELLLGIPCFMSCHLLSTDVLTFVLSSDLAPTFRVPTYGYVRLTSLLTLFSTALLYLLMIKLESTWFIEDVFALSLALMCVRVYKFRSLKTLSAVYVLIFGLLAVQETLMKARFDWDRLKISIPNTYSRSNPYWTCSQISILEIILPAKLLAFGRNFQRESRIDHFLLPLGYIGYLSGVMTTFFVDESYGIELPTYWLGVLLIYLLFILIERAYGTLKQAWLGLAATQPNAAIKIPQSYELTVDKFQKQLQ